MLSTKKQTSIVGLDVEAGSVAATEVTFNGSVEVANTAVAPLEPGIFKDGEVVDADALSSALRSLFAEHKLSKGVRLGIANQRVAVRTMRLPLIENDDELDTAIRFQAQDHLPMPLDQAVLDYQIVGRGVGDDGTRSMEVVAVAARRDMLRALIESVRGAGLRAEGIDLSAFGLIRALAREPDAGADVTPPVDESGAEAENYVPATLYCNLGDVTNLAVAKGSTCLFTRIAPFGVEVIAQRLAERRSLAVDHARQWLTHVGLSTAVEEIEGDSDNVTAAREALQDGGAKLADELRLSLEFYGAQEGAATVERIVVAGPGSTIPGLVEHLQGQLGHQFSAVRPQALAPQGEDRAARLTVSYGLALDE
ncbi:MAG: type IV pilus assembly protein PilM [Actinomycetota bacterium]